MAHKFDVKNKKRLDNEKRRAVMPPFQTNRIHKNGGTLVIIEWEKIQGEFGPPVDERLSYEDVAHMLSQNGYESIEKHGIGADFYGITARKV